MSFRSFRRLLGEILAQRPDIYAKDDAQNRREHSWMLDKLTSSKMEELKVLDVGCGCGYFISRLKRRFPHVEPYGIDVNRSAISLAKKWGGLSLILSSAEKLPFKNNVFQAVVFQNLLHHLVEKNRFSSKKRAKSTIDEIKRVLQSGGHLIAIEQCIASLVLCHIIFLWTSLLGTLRHQQPINFLVPHEIYRMLETPVAHKKEILWRIGPWRWLVRAYIAWKR